MVETRSKIEGHAGLTGIDRLLGFEVVTETDLIPSEPQEIETFGLGIGAGDLHTGGLAGGRSSHLLELPTGANWAEGIVNLGLAGHLGFALVVFRDQHEMGAAIYDFHAIALHADCPGPAIHPIPGDLIGEDISLGGRDLFHGHRISHPDPHRAAADRQAELVGDETAGIVE